jgi:hypothetical protein
MMANINGILSSIEKKDANSALQFWARANFNYYMAAKHDDGVLFINVPAKTFIYYNSAEDLETKGLRLDVDTTYLSGNDSKRTVFPQTTVDAKDYGANELNPELEKVSKLGTPKKTSTAIANQLAQQKSAFLVWSEKFADRRNVTDRSIIPQMADVAFELKKAGVPTEAVIAELEQQFPQLTNGVVRARQVPTANRLYTPYVPPTSDEEEQV